MSRPYVLLAEDNPDDERLALRAIAKALPHALVKVARDGFEALDELLHEDALRPDLVLLDIRMPKVSGLEVLAKMRNIERCRGIPVVMLTSSDEPSDIRSAYLHGANS